MAGTVPGDFGDADRLPCHQHKLVSVLYDGEIEESNEFDSDDYDVYIDLP